MAKSKGQFSRVAVALSSRFSELTGAAVLVIDERERIVSSNSRLLVGRALGDMPEAQQENYLRVPFHCDGRHGAAIIGPPNNGEVLSQRLAQTIVDLVVNQVQALSSLPNRYEIKNKFIHDLLHGRAGDEADILREAQILGMHFNRPRAVILIEAGDFLQTTPLSGSRENSEVRLRRRSQTIINGIVNFFCLPDEMICAYIGDGEVAVLKASSPQDLSTWIDPHDERGLGPSWADLSALKRASAQLLERLRSDINADISIAIGRYHPGVLGLASSYQDARATLTLGRRFHGSNKVHCLDELGVAAFVGISDEETKLDLARQLLSPLEADTDLLKTLEAYFATNCSPSATAAKLVIHRNTLTLRLNKVRSLTGLDPHKFDDIVLIRLAMLLRSSPGGLLSPV